MTALAVSLGAAPSPLWYASRGSGLVSLVLFTAVLVLGIITSVRWSSAVWPRFLTQDIHRDASLLVLVFLGIHIMTSVLDPFARLRAIDAVVPFVAAYRPVWLGLGVVATELFIALVVTSIARRRLSLRLWRAVHWSAYACWPVAVLHGLGTGTDTRLGWSLAITSGCVVAVVAAGAWRLVRGWPVAAGVRAGAGLAGLVALAGGMAWAVTGPLGAGWARRAGTPADLLASSAAAPAAAVAPGLSLSLTGQLSDDGTTTTVTMADGATPATSLRLTASDQGSTADLVVKTGGSEVCRATATIAQPITAVCGSTPVQLTVQAGVGSAVSGRLTTGLAP